MAEWMRTSVKAMPIIESIHVLAAATVFGTIFIVDLRLLGFPNTRRAFTRVSDELLKLDVGCVLHRFGDGHPDVHGEREHVLREHGVPLQDGWRWCSPG